MKTLLFLLSFSFAGHRRTGALSFAFTNPRRPIARVAEIHRHGHRHARARRQPIRVDVSDWAARQPWRKRRREETSVLHAVDGSGGPEDGGDDFYDDFRDADDEGGDGASLSSFDESLAQRIASVEDSDTSFEAGLRKRVRAVEKADKREAAMSYNDDERDEASASSEETKRRKPVVVDLPVVVMDALLPNQRLSGSTTDPTFIDTLRSLGLGGSFVMTSLNNRQRKVRRYGVVARIEFVDVEEDEDDEDGRTPTAATFIIAGRQRCEIIGPADKMKARVGRWRRGYDPDGEEARLGWGEEWFTDDPNGNEHEILEKKEGRPVDENFPSTRQNKDVLIIDESREDADAHDAVAKATYLLPLIEQWIALASDQTTYDNTDVVARTRTKSGQPGLSVNASVLLRKVREELGPMPPPTKPTAFAVWGAALINPLPALGVAMEIRGAVLEASGAEKKLAILERGLIKSINNLDGTKPLGL